jgi:D-lactate dehydrogenase (quinone)
MYTQMAVFAQVDAAGKLHLVNHLGIRLGDTPEDVLRRLDRGEFPEADIQPDAGAASDRNYVTHAREIDADTPARFNADPRRLYETSGSAGKLMVFAVRLDTFPIEQDAKVFYIGTNRPEELPDIRRHALHEFTHLPISGQYLHRDAFDIAEKYSKDTFLTIHYLGTSRLPALFALKNRVDSFFDRLGFLPSNFTDRVMQVMSGLFPSHLPPLMKEYRNKYERHLLLKVPAEGAPETKAFLEGYFAKASGGYFECSDEEGNKAFLHRFAAAGAAVRYRAVHRKEIENIVALDIALRRNDPDWREKLPPEIDQAISIKLYHGHFLCHVFHQDYVVKKGNDCVGLEHKMWKLLHHRGAEYPAEQSDICIARNLRLPPSIRNLIHVTASIPESGKCRSSPNIARLLPN